MRLVGSRGARFAGKVPSGPGDGVIGGCLRAGLRIGSGVFAGAAGAGFVRLGVERRRLGAGSMVDGGDASFPAWASAASGGERAGAVVHGARGGVHARAGEISGALFSFRRGRRLAANGVFGAGVRVDRRVGGGVRRVAFLHHGVSGDAIACAALFYFAG